MTRTLREGFSTGSAAAAAAAAAVRLLLGGELPAGVVTELPPFVRIDEAGPMQTKGADRQIVFRSDNPQRLTIAINAGGMHGPDVAWASVLKDGGDDPDATHGARIIVCASLGPFAESLYCSGPAKTALCLYKAECGLAPVSVPGFGIPILLYAGQGVGRVTLPGLPVPVGEAAINPEPRKQIAAAAASAAAAARGLGLNPEIARAAGGGVLSRPETGGEHTDGKGHDDPCAACQGAMEAFCPRGMPASATLHLLVSVADGEAMARRTLNPRLGILGGISILGTRGTVRPYSHEAWKATIAQALDVAIATGLDELLFATGRRSERLGFSLYPHLPARAGIQVADYAAFSLRGGALLPLKRIIWVCFPGKLLKLAQGLEWTHAKGGEADIALLAELWRESGGEAALGGQIAAMPTAAGAFALMDRANRAGADKVLRALADRAHGAMRSWMLEACGRAKKAHVPDLRLHVFATDEQGEYSLRHSSVD
ncbi:cobalt-precorrin-5B (C(1))-methyltransferase [Desulfovibrio sp. OttesenSCG-928-A18]|nr:cobalt-precorrin-5B (C(1))-methyltransferase [Desulfovibrio sp. OttesenSCG-928-A18]